MDLKTKTSVELPVDLCGRGSGYRRGRRARPPGELVETVGGNGSVWTWVGLRERPQGPRGQWWEGSMEVDLCGRGSNYRRGRRDPWCDWWKRPTEVDLCGRGVGYRRVVGTADGRPYPTLPH